MAQWGQSELATYQHAMDGCYVDRKTLFKKICVPVLELTNHCGYLSIDHSHRSYLPRFSHQVPNLCFGVLWGGGGAAWGFASLGL